MPILNFRRRPQNELERGGRSRARADQTDPESSCPNCHRSWPVSSVWANFNTCPGCGWHYRTGRIHHIHATGQYGVELLPRLLKERGDVVDVAALSKRLGVPAGAQSLKNFSEKCTGCQICVSACKANILKPSLLEWGLSGLMQPYMDFTDGYCLYTCHACTKACPTGAIKFLSGREKKRVKTGTAKFKPSLCVVKTDGTDCAACAEHCPVQAIEMIPFNTKRKSAQFIPHVHEEVCIGCGACEYICPVRPHRAIVVQGLSEHREAKEWNDSMRIYKLPSRSAPADSAPAPAPDNPFPF